MKLAFDLIRSPKVRRVRYFRLFAEKGGVIGSGRDVEWYLPSIDGEIETKHVKVIFEAGCFYIIPIGDVILFGKNCEKRLLCGKKVPVHAGELFSIGHYLLKSRLISPIGAEKNYCMTRTVSFEDILPLDEYSRQSVIVPDFLQDEPLIPASKKRRASSASMGGLPCVADEAASRYPSPTLIPHRGG